jgi:hypothetical protein
MQTLRGAEAYVRVALPDCAELHSVGEPALPFRTARILLPPGCKLAGVRAELLAPVQALNLSAPVEFGRTAIPFGPDRAKALAQAAKDAPDPRIYNSDAPYPAERARLLSVQRLHGHDIALVSVFPVQYVPAKKQLLYCPKVRIELELSATLAKATTGLAARKPRTRAAAVAAFVDNPQALTEYGEGTALLGAQSSQDPVPRPAGSTYDYLLISKAALLPSFDPLVAQKVADGLSVKTETVENIHDNYAGVDDPEKIRTYIQYAYATWGIQYVLLGGDASVVPYRGAYARTSGYTEHGMPTDLYYACLDGSWNYDGDSDWGEPQDAEPGHGDVDLLAEVYVGRAPVDTPDEVATFVSKTVRYEQSGTPNASKALFLAEFLGPDGYPGVGYQGGVALDRLLPFFSGFTVSWLDDRWESTPQWGSAECIPALNQSPHIVAHNGHGSQSGVLRITRSQIDSLTNADLFLVNSTACLAGGFDASDAIGEDFVKRNARGAFAVVMNTRYGWFSEGKPWKWSGQFQEAFFDQLLTQGVGNIGRAHQLGKHTLVAGVETSGDMTYRWCYFENTLLGDPHTALKTFAKQTLNVRSYDASPGVGNYFNGVSITLNPPTSQGATRTTEFNATYAQGTQVTLTAPESYSINLRFQRWKLDGADQPEREQQLTVTMAADHAAVAVYKEAPVLSLVETAASQYVRPGEAVTVKLNVSGLTGHDVKSVQTLLEYDATRLGDPKSVAKSAAPPWCDGAESGPAYDGNKIDYGITLAEGTSADAEVAVLTFTAGSTEGTAYVRFRADEPAAGKVTKLTELPGPVDLFPVKQDAGPIVIDGTNPSVVLSSPNGGETFTAGDWCEIAWSVTEANPYTITLEYSTNGGASWTLIDTFDWDFGSYWWEVPAVNSNACRVRVKATDGAGNFGQDMSDANFTISSPTLTVKSFNTTSAAYFSGVPITASPAPDAATEFTRSYVSGTQVTLTAPATHAGLEFVRWRLDSVDQTQGQRELAVTMAADHEVVAVYRAQGLVIDMQVLQPGTSELNPTGPGPRSLTILSISMPGDPQTTQIAVTIGGGQWLQFVTDSQSNVDVYPTGAAAEWHTAAEWATKRLRGLTPNTTYSFQAKRRDGPGAPESELSDVGTYSTNRDRDVDRSGTVDGTDLAFARDAVLSSAAIGQAGKAWATDVNDSRTTTVYDVTQIRNRMLGVD